MNEIDIIGTTAATLTTYAFMPQAYKVYKTKHTKDLSFYTYFCLTIGTAMWLVYGILLNSYPIIIANVISFALSCFILLYKRKYG